MSKPTDLKELEYSRFSVKPGIKPLKDEIIVYGFDTETGLGGNITVLACSDGSFEYGNILGDVLSFLTKKKYQKSFNFFYNLGFDHNAIFRSLFNNGWKHPLDTGLNINEYEQMSKVGSVKHEKYILECIPGKLLKIKKNKKVWKYYDISKFYKGGVSGKLTDVYKEVFGKSYTKIIDASKGIEYIDDKVVKYCIEDAIACKDLAENLVYPTNKIVPMRTWYSGATIAKNLRRLNLSKPYSFKPSRLQQFAMFAYGGARIEVFKRGSWGFNNNDSLYMYDIRSAYPSVQCELYDVVNAISSKEPIYIPDSLHSFFLITLKIEDCIISPLKYRFKGVIYYPKGQLKEVWVDKNELELLIKYDIKFKIIKAAHDISAPTEKPYEYLKDLYDKRMLYKNSSNLSERQLQFPLKLGLNSSYGMTCERVNKHFLTEFFSAKDQENEDNYIINRGGISYLAKSKWRAGTYFNPVHACEITSAIRCKLYMDSIKYDEHIVKYATDSITFDKPVKLDFGDKLGQYEDSPSYKGVVVGSGVYSLFSEKKKVLKFRSFDSYDLAMLAANNGDKACIKMVKKSPIKLKEASRENYRWFNTFQEKYKEIDINFDHRRSWEKDLLNMDELMKGSYDSKPLDYCMIK